MITNETQLTGAKARKARINELIASLRILKEQIAKEPTNQELRDRFDDEFDLLIAYEGTTAEDWD
jgi:hypothetical protein